MVFVTHKRILIQLITMSCLGFSWRLSHAGSQVEEPLADSVRTALSAAIRGSAPPTPYFDSIQKKIAYLRWLSAMSARMARHTHMQNYQERKEFLAALYYEATRAGLDKALVLAVIQVESAFRKYAISRAGARGFMQVMPFWTKLIGDGRPESLFHMQTNLRMGCVILRYYLDLEKGDLFYALGRYNGSRGKSTYPNSIFKAMPRWVYHPTVEANENKRPP